MAALLNDPQWSTFLATIRANLADDTVRLVAADWLDENAGDMECDFHDARWVHGVHSVYSNCGPYESSWEKCPGCGGSGQGKSNGFAEYAELIRIQCELARLDEIYADRNRNCRCDGGNNSCSACLDESGWNREAKPLMVRAEKLWIPPTSRSVSTSAHTVGLATVILDGQPQPGSVYRSWGIARRGFIDEIHCPMSTWLEHGPKIVRLPTAAVRKVVTDRSPIGVAMSESRLPPCRWLRDDGSGSRGAMLPDEIFLLIPKHPIANDHYSHWGRFFDSPDLAHAALSDACLAWAWASEPAVNV